MITSSCYAIGLILACWLVLLFVFIGIGLLIGRCFSVKQRLSENLVTSFWIGWACTIFFLQLWHLFFKVDWRAFVLISIVGIVGVLINAKALRLNVKRIGFLALIPGTIISLVLLWLANAARFSPINADTGLYHLLCIRWANTFAIVPGLGNLFGHLAFNNAQFLYAAMLNVGPWYNHAYTMANGILLFMLFVQFIVSSFIFLKHKGMVSMSCVFNVATFILLLVTAPQQWYLDISSPNADFPVFILGIVLASGVFAFFDAIDLGKNIGYSVFFVALIAAVGITIKLSFVVLALSSLLLTIIFLYLQNKNQLKIITKKTMIWVGTPLALGIIPWMIRNVILSGYLVYPCPLISFPFDWRIPYEDVAYMAREIQGWARADRIWQQVSENWAWFNPWLRKILHNTAVIIPLFVGLFCLLLILLCKKQKKIETEKLFFLLIPTMALVYWFVAAPDPRFAGSAFLIMGSSGVTFAVLSFAGFKRLLLRLLPVFVPILFVTFVLVGGKSDFVKKFVATKNVKRALNQLYVQTDNRKFYAIARGWVPAANHGFYELPQPRLKKIRTKSGLVVYGLYNTNDDKLWDAPIPATPHSDGNFKLRQKNNLVSGFAPRIR